MLSLEGYLSPPNEPDSLIEAAFERGWPETLKGRRRAARLRQPRNPAHSGPHQRKKTLKADSDV